MEKEKITVAFFLPSLEPGGTERNVVNLVNNIDKNKYIISLVLGKREGDFLDRINNDIPIINLDASYSLGLFFKLVEYFKIQKPDIFVSAFPRINVICIAAKIFSVVNTKIIITEHSVFSLLPIIAKTFWRRIFARFFMPNFAKCMYPKADVIICVSKGIADDLLKIIYCPEKITVIGNPIIENNIYTLADQLVDHPWFSDSFDSTQGKSKIPVIIAVGRLVKCKDYPTLFKAFDLVIKSQPAHLVILGQGPERERLIRLADKMGLSINIAFLGFQKNPYKYMARGSVFVLSSLQEGFGNAIIEAMACGTPVVSTNCPTGPGEIIEDMKNGMLVPVGDEKSMAMAILKILHNPVLAEKFSIEGKKRAEFFSVKKSVGEYEKVFQTLVNEHR